MKPILRMENPQVEYRSREFGREPKLALKGLSLCVGQGEVFGFLGPNGAGKTTAINALLMGSVNFFNEDRIVRYLKEICLLLIWISALVIAVATGARQIPAERENRTIFPLLAKPVTRAELMLGKFLGCWLACGLVLLVFYSFFGVVSGAREHQLPALHYFQALWLQWMLLQ